MLFFSKIEKSFRAKLVLGSFLVVIVIILINIVFSLYNVLNLLNENLLTEGRTLVNDLSYISEIGILSGDAGFIENAGLNVLTEQDAVFVVVYDKSGNEFFSKIKEGYGPIPSLSEGELKNNRAIVWHASNLGKESIYEFLNPIREIEDNKGKGDIIGYSRIGMSRRGIQEGLKQVIIFHLILASLIILLAWIGLFLVTGRILRTLYAMTNVVHKVLTGNLDSEIEVDSKDEFGVFADVFNQMMRTLKSTLDNYEEEKRSLEIRINARTRELKELTHSLDEQVKEKTKELQSKVRELEIINKVAVGRELKMIELKKEIKTLKDKLNENEKD